MSCAAGCTSRVPPVDPIRERSRTSRAWVLYPCRRALDTLGQQTYKTVTPPRNEVHEDEKSGSTGEKIKESSTKARKVYPVVNNHVWSG